MQFSMAIFISIWFAFWGLEMKLMAYQLHKSSKILSSFYAHIDWLATFVEWIRVRNLEFNIVFK